MVPLDENERKHLKVMGQKYTEARYSLNTAHKNKICINDADIFMISHKVYFTPYLMESILQESLNDKFWYVWIILEAKQVYASVAKHFAKHC